MIRDADSMDWEDLVRLNNAEVPHVSRLEVAELATRWKDADAIRVWQLEGHTRAFTVLYGPNSDYPSKNYRWFRSRWTRFYYLDRIVVSPQFQGRGIGRRMMEDASELGRGQSLLTCEVNLQPPNPRSMAFHLRLGFRRLGEQWSEQGRKRVAMLGRDLIDRSPGQL
ncbi:MAG: GNAT family N-acetyltransferase [Myxococcota bacterium]